MRARRAGTWILLAAALALGPAGCSGGGSESAPSQASQAPAAPAPPQAAPEAQPATSPAAAQAPATPPAPDPAFWYPRFDWALEMEGKPAPEARFFLNRDGRRVLVHVPGLPEAAILEMATKQIMTLKSSAVTLDEATDGARVPLDVAQSGTEAPYTLEPKKGEVLFFLGTRRMKVTPKQPLVGPATSEMIVLHSPIYGKAMKAYTPDPAEVAFLKSYPGTVEIEVYFGTWCPHCKVLVPKFMRAMEAAGNERIKVSYVGVPRRFDEYPPARGKGINGVPAFIFYKDGREFGRIPGEPPGLIEAEVARILRTQNT